MAPAPSVELNVEDRSAVVAYIENIWCVNNDKHLLYHTNENLIKALGRDCKQICSCSFSFIQRSKDNLPHLDTRTVTDACLQMIIIAKPSKPFTFTGKGSIRKSAVVADYAEEIEDTYAAADSASSVDVPTPEKWTKDSTATYVKQVVLKVLENKINDDDDIFQNGGDR